MNLQSQKPIVVGVCVIAIAASIISLFITQCPRAPKMDIERYASASFGLAQKVGQDFPNGGKMVLVVMDPKIGSQVFNAQQDAFDREFSQYKSKFTEVERYIVKMEDISRGSGSGMPSSIYLDIMTKHPDVNVIVSVVGIPTLTDAELEQLPQNLPKLYALIMYGVGVRRAFEEGIISIAVLPRYDAQAPGGSGGSPEENFKKYYQYVDETNYEKLTY